jgi:hypothetical protein
VTDNGTAVLVKDDKDHNLWVEVIVQRNGAVVMTMNKRTHNVVAQDMTPFLVPYESDREHNKYI